MLGGAQQLVRHILRNPIEDPNVVTELGPESTASYALGREESQLRGTPLGGTHSYFLFDRDYLDRKVGEMADTEFHFSHIPFSPALGDILEDKGVRSIIIMRQPRDWIVSAAKDRMHRINGPGPDAKILRLFDRETDVSELIRLYALGSLHFSDIKQPIINATDRYASYADWAVLPEALLIRFEDLVPESGGGSEDRSKRTISRIMQHVGRPLPDDEIQPIYDHAYKPHAPSRGRRGSIGGGEEYSHVLDASDVGEVLASCQSIYEKAKFFSPD